MDIEQLVEEQLLKNGCSQEEAIFGAGKVSHKFYEERKIIQELIETYLDEMSYAIENDRMSFQYKGMEMALRDLYERLTCSTYPKKIEVISKEDERPF